MAAHGEREKGEIVTSCPSCGTSILFQSDHSQCGHCGRVLSSAVKDVAIREASAPSDETVQQQLVAALEHAREFYRDQGQEMTWELTATGATYYLDGEIAGDARYQPRAGNITEAIYITKTSKCPKCQTVLNAVSGGEAGTVPEAGELTVCAVCVTPLVFTEHGGRRLATRAELRRLDAKSREDLATVMRDVRIQQKMGLDTRNGLDPHLRSKWEI